MKQYFTRYNSKIKIYQKNNDKYSNEWINEWKKDMLDFRINKLKSFGFKLNIFKSRFFLPSDFVNLFVGIGAKY